MLSISSGCASTTNRIAAAAAEEGKARAQVVLPPLPGECRREVQHAAVQLGANAVAVLARERGQLDIANGIIRRCAHNYDTLKADLEGQN